MFCWFLSSVCVQYNTREWKTLNIKNLFIFQCTKIYSFNTLCQELTKQWCTVWLVIFVWVQIFRTFIEMTASTLGLVWLYGLCFCAYIALFLISWVTSAVKGTIADTLLLAAI